MYYFFSLQKLGTSRNEPKSVSSDYTKDLEPNSAEKIKKLLLESEKQEVAIKQMSNAIDFCESRIEFKNSITRVETERLLRLAYIRKILYAEEMSRIKNRVDDIAEYHQRADILLKDISLPLKKYIHRPNCENTNGMTEWYFVVVIHGVNTWSSGVVECPSSSVRLYFEEEFAIPNLTADFKISVEIYRMFSLKDLFTDQDRYDFGSERNESDSNQISAACPSPGILSRKNKRRLTFSSKKLKFKTPVHKDSMFQHCGSLELKLKDLNLKGPWTLVWVKK